MRRILVDTSIWIEYFRHKDKFSILNELIQANQICINDLILAELIPSLYERNEKEVIESLLALERIDLTIRWNSLIHMQIQNIKNGLNRVGIPDLILLQNVMDNNLLLFSIDKHFRLMQELFSFHMFHDG
jgi:hypothetical protein